MTLNLRPFIIPGIFIITLLLCTGCTQSPVPIPVQTPVPAVTIPLTINSAAQQGASREEMVAFVQEAVAYAKQNGKEKALAGFSSGNGSFFRGVLYIYAYDINGTTIAHPVNPEKMGVNRLNETDTDGNLFIQDLRQAAYNGTGFASYTYINPTHNNTVERKLGYAMKVDDS